MEKGALVHRYIAWFHRNYPDLQREMKACNHNYDTQHLNPYHLESDCWSHTMMVCNVAKMSRYDKVVQIAALLHDIGKPAARKVNPRNNHIRFFGHESLSAQLSKEILDSMIEEHMIDISEKEEIVKLVENHSFLHRNDGIGDLLDAFEYDVGFCIHLTQLSRCDSLGRFCEDDTDDERYRILLDTLAELKINPLNHRVNRQKLSVK